MKEKIRKDLFITFEDFHVSRAITGSDIFHVLDIHIHCSIHFVSF